MSDQAPFWMTAKRDGQCHECEGDIRSGERIVYDPTDYVAYCSTCGEDVIEDLRGAL